MSGFSREWLRLREPHDLAARDRDCMERYAAELRRCASRPLRLLDLASGSGASVRALAPVIGTDQIWTLTDHDADLLSSQVDESMCLKTRRRMIDLAGRLDELDFAAFDGITTSAFLDLVSQSWLDRFAAKLVAAKRPLLAMLTVDGRRVWQPAHSDDDAVHAAFTRHQSSDKGFGPALGTAAATRLASLLRASGYAVTLARSDWRIDATASAMLNRLLEDTLHAASEACPAEIGQFRRWQDVRQQQLAESRLSLVVGHLDLLALPLRDST